MRLSKSDYEALLLARPHLRPLDELQAHQPKPVVAQALDNRQPKLETGKSGVAVRVLLVACIRKRMDDDNVFGSLKSTRDAIAATLRIDDGDSMIQWEYAQAITKGPEGVLIKISPVNPQSKDS